MIRKLRWLPLLLLPGCFPMCPGYTYVQQLGIEADNRAAVGEGHSTYLRAEQDRKVKVLEAQASMESAKLRAEAEVARAEGVAKANKIIGDSLRDNEAYLRWLWIEQVGGADGNNKPTVIYVPTEANLPILEAGKRP